MSTAADLRAVAALAGTPHRVLAPLTTPSLVAQLTTRLATPAPLAELLGALGGRFVVTNPCATARLPGPIGPLVRSALRRVLFEDGAAERLGDPSFLGPRGLTLGDARDAADARRLRALLAALDGGARTALAPGRAAWTAVALYEPRTLAVSIPDLPAAPTAPSPRPIAATPRYRLVLVVGRGAHPTDWAALDEAACAATAAAWPFGEEPLPWFVVRVLVSDATAAAGMDASSLAQWAALTGRAGPTSRDRYWFPETWERFREPQRSVGHVTPAVVARSRRGTTSGPPTHASYEGDPYAEAVGNAAYALNPAAERGVTVPPGYCLVDCAGTLEVAVVTA